MGDNEYENLFNNYSDGKGFNLFREQSIDLDNFIHNEHESDNLDRNYFINFNTNRDLNYDLQLDEFRIDKSDTKSNTKKGSPDPNFDINSNLIIINLKLDYFANDHFQRNINFKSEINKMKENKLIFKITKEQNKINKISSENYFNNEMNIDETNNSIINNEKSDFNLPKLSISERMKIKKQKTKILLGGKKKRETESEEYTGTSNNSTYSKDYMISEDKLIPLSDRLDKITKKEIKILRNRISAQKSRDRRKKELDELRIISDNLFNQNDILQKKLDKTEKELYLIKRKVIGCERCNKGVENITKEILNLKERNNNNNTRININDMSTITRNNFQGRKKMGILTGIFLICFIIGCLIFNPPKEKNIKIKSSRILSIDDDNINNNINNKTNLNLNNSLVKFTMNGVIPNPDYKKQLFNVTKSNNLNNNNTLPVEKKNFPIALRKSNINSNSLDENLLGRKRYEFLVKILNKMRVSDSIKEIKLAPRFQNLKNMFVSNEPYLNNLPRLPNDHSFVQGDPNQNSFCINNSDLSCQIKNESHLEHLGSNSIVPNFYFEKLIKNDFKNMEKLQDNVESLICKDYISFSGKKNNKFDEIIQQVIIKFI